jgi:hypothetical protein
MQDLRRERDNIPAMLPDDFHWEPRWQYAKDELALRLGKATVAMLMQRTDGSWTARLECQRGIEAPLVMRSCTSFEAGKAGIEMWATRHAGRLRKESGLPPRT